MKRIIFILALILSVSSMVFPQFYTEPPVIEHEYEMPTQRLDELVSRINDMFQDYDDWTLEQHLIYLRDRPNRPENIGRVLFVMRKWGVGDANKDGKIDCIDHTIIFRKLYGSNAKIIINVNPQTNMNHMFIQVLTGNRCVDIEPQGTPDRYAMGAVWGTRYNPAFNRDVTAQWGGW